MRVFRVSILLVLALAGAAPAFAQAGATGVITGVVLDPDGKAVGDAAIVVRPTSGRVRTAIAAADGTFTTAALPADSYTVEVNAPGFAPARREGITLAAGKTQDVSITLTVAPFSEEVTVSSRLPEEIRNAPSQGSLSARSPQSQISETFIRNYTSPVSDYSQVVQMAPGAYSVSPNGPGLGDTKTNFRAFADKQLTITFDGIPFNDTNDASHHSWVFFPSQFTGGAVFDRSPGSAASVGPANFGGSIGLLSRNMTAGTVVTGTASLGSFNTRLYDAEVDSGPLGANGQTSFVIDAHQMTSDGYQTFNSQKRDAFMGKVRYALTTQVALTFFSSIIDVHANTPNQKGPTRAQVAQFGDNFRMTSDPASPLYYGYNFYHVPTDFEYIGTRADLGHGWTLDDKTYTYRYYNKQNFNSISAISPTSATDKFNSYRKVGNLLPITQVSDRGVFRTGLWSEYAWTNRYQYPSDPRTWVDTPLSNFHEKYLTTTLQPYAEYQFRVIGNLTVTPGLKLADDKQDFTQFADNGKTVGSLDGAPSITHAASYSTWQPSLDVHYLVQRDLSVYAQYATGNLIPPTSVFDTKNAAVVTLPKPVTTDTYQVGSVWKIKRMTLDVDAYHIHFDNDYSTATDAATGEPVYFLAGTSVTKGVEAESNIRLWDGLSAYLNATAGTAKYQNTGLWIAGAPRDTETLGLNYQNTQWNVAIFNKRVGRTYNDNGAVNQAVTIDPFNLANVFVNYTLNDGSRFSKSKIRLAVNNLTDSHRIVGVVPASTKSNLAADGDVLTLLPGRSVSLTLTFGVSGRSTP